MKKIFVALSMVALLAACSGEGGNSTNPSDDESATLSSADGQGSSSSEKNVTNSSSSRCEECNDDAISSSGNAESSSSEKLSESSSSSAGKAKSSSSVVTLANPCKTETEDNCEYGELNDDRDGQIYKTVKLDEQWWMAENLNYADSLTTPSLKGKSWCYDNYADYCAKYGRLYTWAAAVDSIALYDGGNGVDCGFWKRCELPARVQGICPSGWHLPTFDEWTALYEKFGGRSMAGRYLKSQKEWYDYEYRGKDAYGFNALPAGFREDDGYGKVRFDHLRNGTGFWSVTQPDTTSPFKMGAYMFELSDTHYSVSVVSSSKIAGVSIRCVKND